MSLETTDRVGLVLIFWPVGKAPWNFGLTLCWHASRQVMADYLQKFIVADGLLDASTLKEIKVIEDVESEISR